MQRRERPRRRRSSSDGRGRAAKLVLLLSFAVWILGSFLPALARAAEVPIPSAPTRWVEDHAGFLSRPVASDLDRRLEAYERATGHQIVVWIGKTSGITPIDDFAVRTFAAWKLGKKGVDDGLLVMILAEDRKIDIEVGYGLEGVVPDALAKRIIEEIMLPKIRNGDADSAVQEGVSALLSAIDGKAPPLPAREAQPAKDGARTVNPVILGILGILFLIFFITHPSLALQFLFVMMSGRGGGGGGGFGGGGAGFHGGGGRSGGGGARGSW